VINNKQKQKNNRDKWYKEQSVDESVSCSFKDLENGKKIYPEYLVSVPALQFGEPEYDDEGYLFNQDKTGNYFIN